MPRRSLYASALSIAVIAGCLLAAPACKTRTAAHAPATADLQATAAGPQPELVVQSGSHSTIFRTRFSPDGRYIAVASIDGLLKVFDLRMGKEWRTFPGAAGPLYAIAWSPDGQRIAAGGFDKSVHIWDLASGVEVITLPGHSGWLDSLEFSPDSKLLASAARSADPTVAVWDLEQKRLRHALMHTADVHGLTWSRDGKALITASTEVTVWNSENGGRLGALALDSKGASDKPLHLGPDGKLLAIDGADETVFVYDTSTWSELAKIPGGSLLGWRPDGHLLTIHAGHTSYVDPRSGARRPAWTTADKNILDAELAPDGRLLASVDAMQVTLADGASGRTVRTIDSTFFKYVGGTFGNGEDLLHVAWSPDAPVLATGGFDGILRVLDLRRGAAPRSVPAAPPIAREPGEPVRLGLITGVSFTRDGRQVITRDYDGVSLWDPHSLALVRRFAADGATAEAFSADGKLLAIAHGDAVISVYDVASGGLLRSSKGGGMDADCQRRKALTIAAQNSIAGLGWSADGNKIFAAYRETATFVTLDARSFATISGGCAHSNRLNAVSWSDAGDKVAMSSGLHMVEQLSGELGGGDNAVHVFGLAGDSPRLHRLEGHTLSVLGADFSHDGALLATASADRTARLWDMRTGAAVGALVGHGAEVDSVAFSHDGKYLATASYDLSVKIWDLATKAEVLTMVTIGPDGYILETPDHYYTASRQGFESVAFRLGPTVVPVELFDLRLNRPDLVLRRLGYTPPDLLELYEKAYRKRLRKMGIAEAALRPEYHLPAVKLLSDLPLSTPDTHVSLRLTADDTRHDLDRLHVHINDVPLYGAAGIDLRAEKSRHHERTLDIELLPGRNKIQVAALNAAGTESLRQTVEVISTAPASKPDLYVVAVGVSRYADPRMNLKYAAKDARDIAALFRGRPGRFNKLHVLEILDGEASREHILAAREALAASKIGDQVVVFVAGHGMLDAQLDYYFVTHDFDRAKPSRRGLSYDQLESLLDGIPARRKLMMMDTCHSGEVDEDAVRVPPPPPGGARDLADVKVAADFRTFSYGGAVQSPDRSSEVLSQLFADLRRGSGAAVISSASGAEFALESAAWNNGVFTYAVLHGLTSGDADLDRDGTTRVSELRDYVVGEVHRLTRGAQTPTSRRENLEFDFPVL